MGAKAARLRQKASGAHALLPVGLSESAAFLAALGIADKHESVPYACPSVEMIPPVGLAQSGAEWHAQTPQNALGRDFFNYW